MVVVASQRLRQALRIETGQGIDQLAGGGTGRIAPAHHGIDVVIGARTVPAFAPGPLHPIARPRKQMPAPVQAGRLGPGIQIQFLIAGLVQLAHHGHQTRMRHAVGRRAAKQNRFAIGKLHVVGRQVQVQGPRFAAETGGNPARQQIDGRDHTVTSVAVKNDGTGSERFHTESGR